MEAGKKKILVVDDNVYNVEIITAQLIAEGYEVCQAYDGEAALSMIQKERPDLVLLDIIMPGLSGFEVCRRLKDKEETAFIPVILITGLSELEDRIKGLEVGADDFLMKPLNPPEMLARIRSLLRTKELIETQRARDQYVAEFSKLLELEQIRREEESKRKQLYKDVIYAVTNEKLVLLEREELDAYKAEGQILEKMEIKEPRDVSRARHLIEKIAVLQGMNKERSYNLAICISEAVTNVIKHAKEGKMSVYRHDDIIRVWIEDKGPGIDFSQLPKATLMSRFSTKPSLGYGYTILLEFLDHVLLCSTSEGTTVVLEMRLSTPKEVLDIDEFLAAWEDIY